MMAKKLLGLLIILVFASFAYAQQEQLTITTYYPSPHGSYREMRVQRMAIGDTYFGSGYCWPPDICANNVDTNADLVVEGNVGIGTTSPQSTLQVNGGVQVGGDDNDSNNCLAPKAGTLRYNSGKLEYCEGTNWKSAFAGNVYPNCLGPAGYIYKDGTEWFSKLFWARQVGLKCDKGKLYTRMYYLTLNTDSGWMQGTHATVGYHLDTDPKSSSTSPGPYLPKLSQRYTAVVSGKYIVVTSYHAEDTYGAQVSYFTIPDAVILSDHGF
jgi:hypothetical protein